ncbi:porin family protein [Massilia sp. UMI-21]|nr:porin family protein [Massilia sp. UMI-21]
MKATGIVLAVSLLVVGSAQAQLADTPAPRLEAEPTGPVGPLAKGFKRYQPVYGGNETANPNDREFKGFRTDPRLVLGYAFNPYLAIETGFSYLQDKGFHKIDTFHPRDAATEAALAAGDITARSHTTYVAATITVPVSDRLTAYGKFGIAQSEVKASDNLVTPERVRSHIAGQGYGGESATGAYGAVGARYKLNDRATLKGEARLNGSARKFGSAANASGVHGSVGIGF